MKDDDLLKDVLRRATQAEPAVGDAFGRFERHERRAALMRFFTVALVAVASAVLLFRLLPGASRGNEDVVIPGGQNNSDLTNANSFADPVGGYRLNYPLAWIGVGGGTEPGRFYPRVGLNQAEPTVVRERRLRCAPACGAFGSLFVTETARQLFIEVQRLRPGCRTPIGGCARIDRATALDDELRAAGVELRRVEDSIGGRSGIRIESQFPEDFKLIKRNGERVRPHYWCSGCRMREYVVPWTGGHTLYVRMVSPDPADFDSFNELTSFVIDSVRAYTRGDR